MFNRGNHSPALAGAELAADTPHDRIPLRLADDGSKLRAVVMASLGLTNGTGLVASIYLSRRRPSRPDEEGGSMADAASNEPNPITASPEMLIPAIAELLRRIPDTWQTYRPDDLTATQSQALYLVVGAGLVERRSRLRLRMLNQPGAVECTFTATGEYGLVEALEKVCAAMSEEWEGAYVNWQQGETGHGSPFHAESLEPSEWRLTDQGAVARKSLADGEQDIVFDFVLKRGFFDGRPRLMPDGRISQRKPVRGAGALVRMEKVKIDAAVTGTVNIGNWGKDDATFADALTRVLGMMQAKGGFGGTTPAATGGGSPALSPTGGKGPATAAGNVGTTRQSAQGAENVQGAVGPRQNQTRLTKNEANVKAREYLRKHPKAKARELANGIGCSVGLVPELTAWKAVQEERKKRQQKAPKAVTLTDKVTATHAATTKTPADTVAEGEILGKLLAQVTDTKEQERIANMSPEKREELLEAMKEQLGDAQADGLTAAPDSSDDKTKPRFRPRRKV